MGQLYRVKVRGNRTSLKPVEVRKTKDGLFAETEGSPPQPILPNPVDIDGLTGLGDGTHFVACEKTHEGIKYYRFESGHAIAGEQPGLPEITSDMISHGFGLGAMPSLYLDRESSEPLSQIGVTYGGIVRLRDVRTSPGAGRRFIVDPEPPSHLDGFETYLNYTTLRDKPDVKGSWTRKPAIRLLDGGGERVTQIIAPVGMAFDMRPIQDSLRRWGEELAFLQSDANRLNLKGAVGVLKYVNERAIERNFNEEDRSKLLDDTLFHNLLHLRSSDPYRFFRKVVDPNEVAYNYFKLDQVMSRRLIKLIGRGRYDVETGGRLFNDIAGFPVPEAREAFMGVKWVDPELSWRNFKLMTAGIDEQGLSAEYASKVAGKAKTVARAEGWRVKPDDVLSRMAVAYVEAREGGLGHLECLKKITES